MTSDVVLLDVNVLLALTWPNHQHHEAAHRWFPRGAAPGWATCALTQLAFVRLSSNPAFTPNAASPAEAQELLLRLTAHRAHEYWEKLPAPAKAPAATVHGHQQLNDAYFVSTCEQRRAQFATFDGRAAVHATK